LGYQLIWWHTSGTHGVSAADLVAEALNWDRGHCMSMAWLGRFFCEPFVCPSVVNNPALLAALFLSSHSHPTYFLRCWLCVTCFKAYWLCVFHLLCSVLHQLLCRSGERQCVQKRMAVCRMLSLCCQSNMLRTPVGVSLLLKLSVVI